MPRSPHRNLVTSNMPRSPHRNLVTRNMPKSPHRNLVTRNMPKKVSQESSDSQKDMFYKEHNIQTTEY